MLKFISRGFLKKWNLPVKTISNLNMTVFKNREFLRTFETVSAEASAEDRSLIFKQIHSARDCSEMLEMLSRTRKEDIEPQQLCLAFNRLIFLYENDRSVTDSVYRSQLKKHEGFENACKLLQSKGPDMKSNDLVNCLKVLRYFGMDSSSKIVQRILNLLKDQIKDFMPNNLMFLHHLLKKMNSTPLTEALLIAIPMIFDFNLSQRVNHNNTEELTELLHYLSESSMKISNQSKTIIFSALLLNSDSLNLDQAKSIVWSFTALQEFDQAYEKLYHNCVNILIENIMDLSFNDIGRTVYKMTKKYLNGDKAMLSESFLESVVSYLIEKDYGFEKAVAILIRFNKIHFVSYRLLDFMDKEFISNPASLSSCKYYNLLAFAEAFSNAGYRTENWDAIKSIVLENPLLRSEEDFLWTNLALELMSLDIHSNILLEKVFRTNHIEKFLARQKRHPIDCANFLLLWQSVKLLIPDYQGPLPEQRFIDDAKLSNFRKPNERFMKALADVFGGSELVQTNVESSYGHCLDFVISFDSNNEKPIAMPCKIKSYDDLPKSQVKSVAVFFNTKACYPLNLPNKLRGTTELRRRTLEALGIRNAQISLIVWNSLPENERLDYLEKEIRDALKNKEM